MKRGHGVRPAWIHLQAFGRGSFFDLMNSNRRRQQERAEYREKKKAAKALRAKHNLCEHEDDVRGYASAEAADQDERPAAVCPACEKKRLITAIINPNFAQEIYQGVPTQLVAELIAGKMR